MKNKLIKIILAITLSLNFFCVTFAEEFIFKVTELDVTDNGNIYKGINKGKITTATGVEITSDNFEYLKRVNELYTYGNSEVIDAKTELQINAESIVYLKDEEIIYTIGKTYIKISDKYNVEGFDIKLLRNEMILSSLKKATITDDLNNIYKLDEFEYFINQELLKGNKIKVITTNKNDASDTYSFGNGIFDFKKDKFLGKDTSLKFHKTLFDDEENDPRLKSVSSSGDEYNTYFEKALFTSCKDNGKCPPWKIKAKRIHHDKIKKQINYTDAWLSLFDVPVVYFPKFFHPDPTVKRKSGFLRPAFIGSRKLGNSTYIPYFLVISDDKDLTLKPRYFVDNKFILHNEYRQATKKSLTVADFSWAKGHDSSKLDPGGSKSHFFVNTKFDLELEEYESSKLEFNFETASNDQYLKVFNLKSPLFTSSFGVLESKATLELTHEDYDFTSSLQVFETMDGLYDRFQYVLPTYSYSTIFEVDDLEAGFTFNHTGSNTLNTNDSLETHITNNLNFKTFDQYFDNGIKRNFTALFKNLNSIGKKSTVYKSSPQSEIMSTYIYDVSLPLLKDSVDRLNVLEPKMSFRFNPHDMKNHKDLSRSIGISNIYNQERLSLSNTFEGGESLTLGIDYTKQKVINKTANPPSLYLNELQEIEDYISFKLATVFRIKEEEGVPVNSTLNKKTSNIFGEIIYEPTEILELNYTFSVKNDLDTIEYNSMSALLEFENIPLINKFSTEFKYTEMRGIIGSANATENKSEFNFNEENSLIFKTRRNRDISLTEYYDLVYQYKSDCLIAGIDYKKRYYSDKEAIPLEELFFSITIIPLTTFSPDKMILNKNRVD